MTSQLLAMLLAGHDVTSEATLTTNSSPRPILYMDSDLCCAFTLYLTLKIL